MKVPRLVVAGVSSGVGKTTIATGIMAALAKRGLQVQPYKTGPDYIDPGYHTLVSGRISRNLDAYMLQPETLERLFLNASKDADIAVIEGVMGLFDGGNGGIGSTANIAKQLQAPVVLIVDVKAMADSAAAIVLGFSQFDPAVKIAGVILNKVGSDRHYQMVKAAIETKTGIPVLGFLKKNELLTMPERHLGLLPVEENANNLWKKELAEKITACIDLDALVRIAQAAPMLVDSPAVVKPVTNSIRIAIARDAAFTFYYQDGLEALEDMGVELVPFSPISDTCLPDNVHGILFGGGFPEMFVQQLHDNVSMIASIRAAHTKGMPIYAECGGLMYLCNQIVDFEGKPLALVGLVPAECRMQKRLVTVGYVEVEARQNSVLGSQGTKIRGHEFHFSTMEHVDHDFPWAFTFRKLRDGSTYPGGYVKGNLLASYLHCHFAGNPEVAQHFIDICRKYQVAESGTCE